MQGWIDEGELPVWTGLRVIGSRDPDHGMTQEEVRGKNEFVMRYILKTMEPLNLIPI